MDVSAKQLLTYNWSLLLIIFWATTPVLQTVNKTETLRYYIPYPQSVYYISSSSLYNFVTLFLFFIFSFTSAAPHLSLAGSHKSKCTTKSN